PIVYPYGWIQQTLELVTLNRSADGYVFRAQESERGALYDSNPPHATGVGEYTVHRSNYVVRSQVVRNQRECGIGAFRVKMYNLWVDRTKFPRECHGKLPRLRERQMQDRYTSPLKLGRK